MFRHPRSSQLETPNTSFPPNPDVDTNSRIQDIEVGVDEGNGIEYPFWIVTTDLEKAVGIQSSVVNERGKTEAQFMREGPQCRSEGITSANC
jgi:hypothetical protein